MQDVKLQILGMGCSACSNKIEDRLSNSNGIDRVIVSLDSNESNIRYNPKIITYTEIVSIIHELGFDVVDS